jgi:hypothetical protein
MIRGRVSNIVECFTRNRDYMQLAKFELLRYLDTEWEALCRPTENSLANLAPLWANGNFGTNGPDCVSCGIFERNVNVAVCLDFRARR